MKTNTKISPPSTEAALPRSLKRLVRPGSKEWPILNRRRCELIQRDVREKNLTAEETSELAELERIADARVEAIGPMSRPPMKYGYREGRGSGATATRKALK